MSATEAEVHSGLQCANAVAATEVIRPGQPQSNALTDRHVKAEFSRAVALWINPGQIERVATSGVVIQPVLTDVPLEGIGQATERTQGKSFRITDISYKLHTDRGVEHRLRLAGAGDAKAASTRFREAIQLPVAQCQFGIGRYRRTAGDNVVANLQRGIELVALDPGTVAAGQQG